MRLRLHHPLVAGAAALVGLLVVLVVLLVGSGLRREMLTVRSAELGRELALAGRLLDELGGSDPDAVADLVGERLGYRVTLIAPDGTVLGDSEVPAADVPRMESHATRPEVVGALRGDGSGPSYARRVSATLGVDLLYAAIPTTFQDRPVVLRLAAPLRELEASVARIQQRVALAGVLTFLLALAAIYLLARGYVQPLVTLADRAGALAAGDFSRRVPRHRIVELDELASAFNRLADELQARLAELGRERDEMQALIDAMAEGVIALTEDARVLRTNASARELLGIPAGTWFGPVGTVVRHPELRDLLEEAVVGEVAAREVNVGERHLIVSARLLPLGGAVVTFLDVSEIRRLEQVRRDFVANVSHEIKTPLTTVRGFAEALLEEEPPPELRARFLEAIRSNTLRLQHLVDDLLDLSRLESGGWRSETLPVAVSAAARDAWSDFAAAAAEKGVAFVVEGDAVAEADERGLAQVFQNLFDNALRYTPAGGRIRVSVREAGERVEVAVSDTGAGIPSRALPRIFERFYRADPARSREAGGTGLGLAIVRHLLHSMDGEVWAESELGRGTTIRFTLPTAARPGAGG